MPGSLLRTEGESQAQTHQGRNRCTGSGPLLVRIREKQALWVDGAARRWSLAEHREDRPLSAPGAPGALAQCAPRIRLVKQPLLWALTTVGKEWKAAARTDVRRGQDRRRNCCLKIFLAAKEPQGWAQDAAQIPRLQVPSPSSKRSNDSEAPTSF